MKIGSQPLSNFLNRPVIMKIDFSVSGHPPEILNKNAFAKSVIVVYANSIACSCRDSFELFIHILCSLVRIKIYGFEIQRAFLKAWNI